MIGETVSHYTILSQLGEGGMGVVYEAEDSQLGRKVALKFLSEETSSDKSALQRFQREARAASALNHPGICTIHAIEEHNSHHFIVMELLEGETLSTKIRRGPIPLKELVSIGTEITDALESAHAKGIVHRDLKPANIFINDRKQVKILDFGLAKIDLLSDKSIASNRVTEVREELTKAGSTIGTVSYMSPEQARGELTDSRTDIFSLGTVLYQMATGKFPFPGETSAVIFDAILNREPAPIVEADPSLPARLEAIIFRALEKDSKLRYQSATDMKTELLRLQRDIDAQERGESSGSRPRAAAAEEDKSVAVLYFENRSGQEEDEYFRDGVTEDIITELSKISGLKIISRAAILPYRDKEVTPEQIARQLRAAYVLTGSIRRAGNRLRITTQLVDTRTNYPLWSERYDREMKDVFDVQDEIARQIAEALRVTLTPQEQQALSAKPTDNLEAYDLYLRGKNFARRLSRQDLQFALQMFDKAAALDPQFTLAYAAIANVCSQVYSHFDRAPKWINRAVEAARQAEQLDPHAPEVLVAKGWVSFGEDRFDDAVDQVRKAIAIKPDTDGAYYLLGRALFSVGRHQELLEISEQSIAQAGDDYNLYVPILNALKALGKTEQLKNWRQRATLVMEKHVQKVPEDARARLLLAAQYVESGRPEEASKELDFAMILRPDDCIILYNVACIYCQAGRKDEALEALEKAKQNGYQTGNWARKDPDLEPLHGHPIFEKLFPSEDVR